MSAHDPTLAELHSTPETRSVKCPYCKAEPGERCRVRQPHFGGGDPEHAREPSSPFSAYPLVHRQRYYAYRSR